MLFEVRNVGFRCMQRIAYMKKEKWEIDKNEILFYVS